MNRKENLDKCLLSLDVGEVNALFILLAADGTICRKGNGSTDAQLPMLKGHSDQGHFEAFMMTVEEAWFDYAGAIDQLPIEGIRCKLMIVFSGADNAETGFRCMYGIDSQGPPKELTNMLINAVKLTDAWYHEEQLRLMIPHQPTAQERSWWEFWKG